MHPSNENLQRQLRDLSERLDAVERRLGIASQVRPTAGVETIERFGQSSHANDDVTTSSPTAPADPGTTRTSGPPISPPRARPPSPVHNAIDQLRHPAMEPSSKSPPSRTDVPSKPTSINIESLVGGRLFLGVGALIVVVGVGLGLKLGVDRGWFSMPPALRCGTAALFGILLMSVAELARRRINVLASTGLYAAGTAILFSSVLAAWGMYRLVPSSVAFVLLVLVCSLGIGIALRTSSLAIGVLSLVGAYMTPLIFHASQSSPIVLPAYLVSLLLLGLVLAGWRPSPFRALRGVAWWGTVLVGTGWLLSSGHAYSWVALIFLALVWLCVHAELYFGSRREPEAKGVPLGNSSILPRLTRPILNSFATTLWVVGFGVLTVQAGNSVVPAWGVPAAGFLGTMCLGLVLAGNLRIFQDRPANDAERLGAGLWMQAAGLSIVTVALGLSGWTQIVAWLAMGLAAMAAGKWLSARSLDVHGLVVLTIALARLLIYDSWNTPSGGLELLGLALTRWTLLMACAGVGWLGGALLLHRETPTCSSRRRALIDVCIGVAGTAWAAGCITQQSAIPAVLGATVTVGAGLAWAAGWRRSDILRVWSIVALLVATVCAGVGQFNDIRVPRAVAVIGSVILTDFSFALLIGAVGWWLAAFYMRGFASSADMFVRSAMIGIGVLASLLAWCGPASSLAWGCVIWTLTGVGAGLAALRCRRLHIDSISIGTLALAAGLWGIAFIHPAQSWSRSASTLGLHPGLWTAAGIAGSLLTLSWLFGRTGALSSTAMTRVAGAVAGAVVLCATTLEVSRAAVHFAGTDGTAQRAAVSIWWGVFAVGLVVIGFWKSAPLTRHVGLALLAVATTKAAVFDLAGVAAEWRVASFIGLGLLMLGVAIGYARITKRMSQAPVE